MFIILTPNTFLFFGNDIPYEPIKANAPESIFVQTNEQKINNDTEITKRNIFEILNSDKVKFYIPIYQRKYVWNDENINVLFDDIEERIKDDRDHYFGSIVIKKFDNINNTYIIVDGQQRLITSILILLVIKEKLNKWNIWHLMKKEFPRILNLSMDSVFVRGNVFGIEENNNVFKNIWNGSYNIDIINEKTTQFVKNYIHIKKSINTIMSKSY